MQSKNAPGVKSEAKLEAPVSSYSYTQLKSVVSGGGQGFLYVHHYAYNFYMIRYVYMYYTRAY